MDKEKRFRSNGNKGGRKGFRNIGFISLLILFGLIIFAAYGQSGELKNIPLTQAVQQANQGQFKKIEVGGSEMTSTKQGEDKATLKSYKDPNDSLKDIGLNAEKVEVSYKPQSSTG